MPLEISASAPTILVRQQAFERAGLVRSEIDTRYNLTAGEFRVEGKLIAIGPFYEAEGFSDFVEQLEKLGLIYFEDFFELSGNWPTWCHLFAGE
jgi:hypothetical protein